MNIHTMNGFWERARGLLGKKGLPEGDVYLFPRCNAVHTFGMRFALDIAFLDRDGHVVSLHENVRPWRMVFGGRKASATVEAQAGWLGKALRASSPFGCPPPGPSTRQSP